MKALNEQLTLSVSVLSRELQDSKDRSGQLAAQLASHEEFLVRYKEESAQMNAFLESSRKDVDRLTEQLNTKELIIQDLMNIEKDGLGNVVGSSELENKIYEQLESTKSQLKRYEAEIAQRFRDKSINYDVSSSIKPVQDTTTNSSSDPSSVIQEFLKSQELTSKTIEADDPSSKTSSVLDAIGQGL